MRTISVFLAFLLLVSCNDSAIQKPDKLIDEDVMVDIFYDLALLEAIKSQNPGSLDKNNIVPSTYIYKKYKIDSLQFAQSNRYYATEIKTYKRMYWRVSKRLERQQSALDSLRKPKSKQLNAQAKPALPGQPVVK